jgi:hypothetical protein
LRKKNRFRKNPQPQNDLVVLYLDFYPFVDSRSSCLDYEILKRLNTVDFQAPKDREFLKKSDEIKIPALMHTMPYI